MALSLEGLEYALKWHFAFFRNRWRCLSSSPQRRSMWHANSAILCLSRIAILKKYVEQNADKLKATARFAKIGRGFTSHTLEWRTARRGFQTLGEAAKVVRSIAPGTLLYHRSNAPLLSAIQRRCMPFVRNVIRAGDNLAAPLLSRCWSIALRRISSALAPPTITGGTELVGNIMVKTGRCLSSVTFTVHRRKSRARSAKR